MKTLASNWKLALFACLTLGLMPYSPEPHLFGKLRWIMGGATGMTAVDWFDLVQHGLPFAWLIGVLLSNLKKTKTDA